MLHALQSPLGVMPPAASRIYWKFYECANCELDRRYQVKAVYAPSCTDPDLLMPLIFSENQDSDGLMPTWAFEKAIKEKLAQAAGEMGFSNQSNFDAICKAPYEQKHAHHDPELWRKDTYRTIAKTFGIELE